MSKVIYITEQQEQELINKYLKESLVVNSDQVSDIVNYLNKFYQAAVDYAGDVGVDGLPCQTLAINYVVNGQPLQKLKREELLDVINDKFRRFIKDDASRLAYYNQIIDDWLNKKVKLTGQLSVNAISDDMIEKFKNHKKSQKQDNNKKDNDKKNTKNKTTSVNEGIEELNVKHASPHKFDSFDSSHMSSGCGNQSYGWGHYFSTDPHVHRGYKNAVKQMPTYDLKTKKEGSYAYNVEIPDDNGSNYILWDGPTIKGLPGEENSTFGEQYRMLIHKFGTPKDVSMFLANKGYTGIKVAPFRNNREGDDLNTNNPKEKYNYIVFKDDDANILKRKDYTRKPKFYNGNVFTKDRDGRGILIDSNTGVEMFKPLVIQNNNGDKVSIKPRVEEKDNGFWITYDCYNGVYTTKRNFLSKKTMKLLYPDKNPLNWPADIKIFNNPNIYGITSNNGYDTNNIGKIILMYSYTKNPILGNMNNTNTWVNASGDYDYNTGITTFYFDENKTQPIFIGKDGKPYKTEEECIKATRGLWGAIKNRLNIPNRIK